MKKLSRNEYIAVAVGIIFIFLFFGGIFKMGGMQSTAPGAVTSGTSNGVTINQLMIEDVRIGTGAEAKKGDVVHVHYTGILTNGELFDSSIPTGQPISFTLGEGRVIQGWEQGLLGLKEGGKRRLFIPAELAYGNRAMGSIPANSPLIFEVELMKIGK